MPTTRKKSMTADVTSEIQRLHVAGKTPQEISDLTSVSHAVVMTVLHDAQTATGQTEEVQASSISLRPRKSGNPVPEEDEEKLVDFLVEVDQFNLNWRLLKLRQILRKYAVANKLHDSTHNIAWMKAFMERHSNKITDVPEVIDSSTVAAVFYKVVETVMANLDIQNRPECIWNMEVVSCCASNKSRRVFAVKTRRNGKPPVDDPTEKARAICAISASGKNSSPALIFPGLKIQQTLWSSELPEETKSTVSYLVGTENKSDCDIALQWLEKVFTRDITERPILMFVDSRYGTVDACPLISWAKEQNIHLMCVPSECADVVRPLDVAARWSFRKQWQTVAGKKGPLRDPAPKPSAVVKAFITSYLSAMNEQNVKAAFSASGFFPLNTQAVCKMILLADDQHPLPSTNDHLPANVTGEQLGQDYQEAVKVIIDALIKEGHVPKVINKMLKHLGVAARLKVST